MAQKNHIVGEEKPRPERAAAGDTLFQTVAPLSTSAGPQGGAGAGRSGRIVLDIGASVPDSPTLRQAAAVVFAGVVPIPDQQAGWAAVWPWANPAGSEGAVHPGGCVCCVGPGAWGGLDRFLLVQAQNQARGTGVAFSRVVVVCPAKSVEKLHKALQGSVFLSVFYVFGSSIRKDVS